jgi:hypothetical protein
MKGYSLVEKLYKDNIRQIKFLEDYYSDKIGAKLEISLDTYGDTSYYSPSNHKVFISVSNLIEVLHYNPDVLRPMFYSLMLHEIGHALYTGDAMGYSVEANILEDNRLEHQIAKWNTKAQFELLRYIYQDKRLDTSMAMDDRLVAALGLIRTIDNRPFILELGTTGKRMQIIQDILALNEKYKSVDTMFKSTNYEESLPMRQMHQELSDLLDELMNAPKEDEQKEEPKQDKTNEDANNGDNNTPSDQGNDDPKDKQDTPSSNNQIDGAKERLEEELSEAIQKVTDMMSNEDYNEKVMFNRRPDTSLYQKHQVGAFVTKRNAGIKGSKAVARPNGTAKQLSLKRYMRRDFISNEKLFDKHIDNTARGGKAGNVVFYLDISGSMGGYRIRHATDYLKSFYDSMHEHMNISIYGFGRETYRLTRNELNLQFLSDRLQGTTKLEPVKLKANEEVIVLTDGLFMNEEDIPKQFIRKAHFIFIEPDHETKNTNIFKEAPNKYIVTEQNIVKGLEQATKGLKRLLK